MSVVCEVVAPYSEGWAFRQYFEPSNSSWTRTLCVEISGKNSNRF